MGRGIEMMSTAILMAAGSEQTKVPVLDCLSSHQGGLEGISFAKSFDEGIGISTLLQGKSTVDDAATALQNAKNATSVKKPDEVAEIVGGAGGKEITGRKIAAHSESKSVVAGKNIQVPARGVKEPQSEATASDFKMETVESSAPVQVAVDELSSSSPASGTLATGTRDENLPHPDIPDGSQSTIPNAGRPVIHEATGVGEKVKVDASGKKITNAQESAATPKTVQKSTGKIGNATAVGARPIGEKLVESTTPAVMQEVRRQVEISRPTEGFGKAVSEVTRFSTGVSSVAVDGQVRKQDASGAKASVTDVEPPVTAGGDLVASAKTVVIPEKMAAVAPIGRESQSKPQAETESGATLFHSMGTTATVVVSGDPPVELSTTRPSGGDTGLHQTGLPAESKGQDETVAVAPSMDGAPQMLTATPTSLEIGVQNGTHGWLRVRAEMTEGGVVNASVSAGSLAGQEMLHRELPALTAYLQEEKVAVNAVIVHAPAVSGSDPRSSSAADSAGGQTPQRSNQGEEQHQSLRKSALNGSDGATTYRSLTGVDEDGSLPLAAYAGGGSWLSVRA
jgi:hypothetical protein